MIKISTKRWKELEPENIRAIAKERGISEEDAVFSLMRDVPAMFAIMQDWDDMRTISTAVIRELKPYMSFRNIYAFVMRVVNLYDTQVISVLRIPTESDVKRLAYFVNEMVESMLEVRPYYEHVERIVADESGQADRIIMRGYVLRQITSSQVRDILVGDMAHFFRAEIIRTEPIVQFSPCPAWA